jgi:hypothetical protein
MRAAAVAALLLAVICGCSQQKVEGSPSPSSPGTSLPTRTTSGPPPASITTPPTSTGQTSTGQPLRGDRYVALAGALHKRGVAIWWETDLVARWLEGPAAFDTAIARLGKLASVPGVVGFKVSDEIGYNDGLGSPADATKFLIRARTALARVAPGKQLLVDAVVPELGCLPWRGPNQLACAERVRLKYPAASAAAVEGYLRAKLIDRLDLSTGLLDDSTYQKWGTTKRDAQTDAWNHVNEQGWPQLTILQARKALAVPNGYQGSAEQAAADVGTYIDVPTAAGARAVDIWTWRQRYSGNIVSLLGSDLSPNPLWTALVQQHRRGAQFLTHMTPSMMPTDQRGFDQECDLAASAFTAVFVAAGTG